MTKYIKALIFIIAITSTAEAGCVGVVINGNCQGADLGNNYSGGSNYEGSSGQQYQYDMSNANDRINYSTDLDAQRRDSYNSGNPNTFIDKSTGQYGGGVYNGN